MCLIAVIVVEIDDDGIARDEGGDLGGEGFIQRVAVLDGEGDDRVEADEMTLFIEEDAVRADDAFMLCRDLVDLFAHGVTLFVDRIEPDGDEDPELLIHFLLDLLGQRVQLACVHGVGHLDVDGADRGIGTVIVQDQIVRAAHTVDFLDRLADRLGRFAVGTVAHDAVDRFQQRCDTRFDNEHGDQNADVPVDRELKEVRDQRAHERAGGEDRVEQRVLAGCDERVGTVVLALLFHVRAEQDLDDDRDRDDDEGDEGEVRRLGIEDLLHRFDERRDARGENDRRNDDRREILDASVAKGMFLIRLSAGELDADDRNDRRQSVGEVVHRVQYDRYRARDQADRRLEACKHEVRDDADETRLRDFLLSQIAVHSASVSFSTV